MTDSQKGGVKRPFILVSNDDGYKSGGIRTLIDTLHTMADLLVVAPGGGRSGYGCAITSTAPIHNRLVHHEEGLDIYACSGSPVDCVKLAFNVLLPEMGRTPDLVVTGINHGDNSSVNTFYSGTMGAASEGAIQGIPAVGFSLCDHRPDADFTPCVPIIRQIVIQLLCDGLPPFSTLNVNFPLRESFEGVRVCRMAKSRWVNELAESRRPRSGTPYYWLTGDPQELEPEAEDTDRWALAHGYVAVTPQTLDCTHYDLLHSFRLDAAPGR